MNPNLTFEDVVKAKRDKPNLKVKLPKTWGVVKDLRGDIIYEGVTTTTPYAGWHYVKFPPTIEVKEVSRIITNVRKRWLRDFINHRADTQFINNIEHYTNDLRQSLNLRARARR